MAERAQQELTAAAVMQSIGGARGIVDSAIPATVFVLVNLVVDSLWVSAAVAVASGLALGLLRVSRGETLLQVGSGFLGLVLAVGVALVTGSGEGFFLLGIISVFASGVAFAGSLLVRRPAVGIALSTFDPKYATWREHPGLLRACQVSTAFWAFTFFVRGGVATYVYQLHGDNEGALLIVINAVKWPLIVAAAGLTLFLVRRSGFVPPAEPDEAITVSEPTAS